MDGSFGHLLKRLRRARGLTQEALAQQVYYAADTIKKIEAGLRRPSRQLAVQFADCLELAGDQRVTFLAAARTIGHEEDAPHANLATMAGDGLARTALVCRGKLPRQATPFVGRVVELAALAALFSDMSIRLVTIQGPGGMGKTRLAIALAERLLAVERFPDGICFVSLASLAAPEQIMPALAEALEFRLDIGKQQWRTPQQQVFDYLRTKQLLLVLDNVEHLLGSTEEDLAGQVAALLDAAPRVAILATTRERLKLRAEYLYPLGGLDMPDTEAPSSSSAVALFIQCARRLRTDFVLDQDGLGVVAQICRLVNGMPLAIELAAGWVDSLSLSDIAEEIQRDLDLLATELHDVPPRHRSMRAVFDATWNRLGAADQTAFARLAVFRGGGTRHAVQTVTRTTMPQLYALVGASLLQYDAEYDRYTTHELLRQYAAEQLAADQEDELATRERHAAYYCAFLPERTEALKGAGQEAALRAIEIEVANLQAALAWAGAHGVVSLIAQALEGLGRFYEWRGRYQEGLAIFTIIAKALEDMDVPNIRRVHTHALAWRAVFARLVGQLLQANHNLHYALTMFDALSLAGIDTRIERAFVLLQLGDLREPSRVNVEQCQLNDVASVAASLALYIELGRPWEQSCAQLALGVNARARGDYDLARGHLRACRTIREAVGDRRGLAEALTQDSAAALGSSAMDEALELAQRSLAIYETLGETAGRASALGRLGVVRIWAGLYPEAQRTLAASYTLYKNLGDELMAAFDNNRRALATMGVGDLDEAWKLATQAIDCSRAVRGDDEPQTLWIGGMIALMRGDQTEAVQLLQASVDISEKMGWLETANWSRPWLATTRWLLGCRMKARTDLLALLRETTPYHNILSLLYTLLGIILIFAEQGASERALELYALAQQHPHIANHQACTTFFGQRLDAACTALSPEAVEAAQARGQERDLWATARELLAELESAGWGAGEAA